jgi:hypothetical protein
MRLRLVALLAAVAVSPVLAQGVMQVQPIQRPLIVPQVQPVQGSSDAAQKVMTIEDAQAQIAKLRAEKRELTQKLNETIATLDSWTKKGGSLVHAYCASDTLSQRSDGAGQEDCAASGYACSQAEGTCRRSCNVTTDCAGYYVCDTAAHACVRNG